MSLAGLLLVRARSLRSICYLFAAFFLGVASYLWFTADLKPGETRLVLLYPLATAIALLLGARFLKADALRLLLLAWFAGLPAAFAIVNWLGCASNLFSHTWCTG